MADNGGKMFHRNSTDMELIRNKKNVYNSFKIFEYSNLF